MTTLSNILRFSALSLLAAGTSQAAILTDFSEESFQIDYIDFPVHTQDASGLYVNGNNMGDMFWGLFEQIDITGLDQIYLTATVHENPGSNFLVTLYGPEIEDMREYRAYLEDFGIGVSTRVLLAFESETSGFNEIVGMMFSTGGGSAPLVMTFEELSAVAVPEPTTYALAISAIAFGLIGVRRLRRSR